MSLTPHHRIPVLMRSSIVRRLFTATVPFIALSTLPAMADNNQIYLEDGGYVQFEVEDADVIADWRLNNDIGGYTGTGYFEWTGADYFFENNAGNGIITYHFRVETAGNYELRWRSRIAKGDSNTESNDSWVRFNTGVNVSEEEPLSGWTKVYMGEADIWSWSSRTVDHVAQPVRQYFTQGDHTVEISGRSYGHAIDKIALYRYADVSFDPGLNGTLPLSRYLQQDGSVIDPNPMLTSEPEPETEVESEPESETVLSERVNAETAVVDANDSNVAFCVADTLTIPTDRYASVSTLTQSINGSIDELNLEADTQNLLLSYDLSSLPSYSTANLRYATGTTISNGALDIHLGSHNDWPTGNSENVPAASVSIATAQGGWDANSSYTTFLDASLLPRDETTLILSLQTGSDNLTLGTAYLPSTLPDLLITGDASFCANWESSVAQSTPESPTIDETDTESGTETDTKKSGIGGSSLWFAMLLLSGFLARHSSSRGKPS